MICDMQDRSVRHMVMRKYYRYIGYYARRLCLGHPSLAGQTLLPSEGEKESGHSGQDVVSQSVAVESYTCLHVCCATITISCRHRSDGDRSVISVGLRSRIVLLQWQKATLHGPAANASPQSKGACWILYGSRAS